MADDDEKRFFGVDRFDGVNTALPNKEEEAVASEITNRNMMIFL
jgi:hypothetical protein